MDVLYGQHESKPRNKLIAKAFFYAGFIENWGQGFDKIRRAFEPAGLELPKYENSCGCAVATIKRENFIKMKAGINDTKVVIDNVIDKLTERQKVILQHITIAVTDDVIENVIETTSTLAKKIGVSSRTIARDLDAMKKLGIIEHVGPDKGGYWKVLIHGKNNHFD